jgi:hypothetical protein
MVPPQGSRTTRAHRSLSSSTMARSHPLVSKQTSTASPGASSSATLRSTLTPHPVPAPAYVPADGVGRRAQHPRKGREVPIALLLAVKPKDVWVPTGWA